jgi:hypothetical protein
MEAMSVFHLCPARTMLALLWHRRKLSEETIDG